MCGNSVCPPLAKAIVAANYSERERYLRMPVAAPVFPQAPEISEADVPY